MITNNSFFERLEPKCLMSATPGAADFDPSEYALERGKVFTAIKDAMVVVAGGELSVVNVASGSQVSLVPVDIKLASNVVAKLKNLGVQSPETITTMTEIRVDGHMVMGVIRPVDNMSIPLSSRRIADQGISAPSVVRDNVEPSSSSLVEDVVG